MAPPRRAMPVAMLRLVLVSPQIRQHTQRLHMTIQLMATTLMRPMPGWAEVAVPKEGEVPTGVRKRTTSFAAYFLGCLAL